MRPNPWLARLLAGALVTLGLMGGALAQDRAVVLPYDGALDLDGAPAAGLYDMRFSLYAAPTGGAPLWTEAWTVADGSPVRLASGRFHVALGRHTPIGEALAHGGDVFLGIEVKAPGAEAYLALAGRQRLDPVGHALYSLTGERLAVPELSVGGAATAATIELGDALTVTGTFTHEDRLVVQEGVTAGDATVSNVGVVDELDTPTVNAERLRLTSTLTVPGRLDAARLAFTSPDFNFPTDVQTPSGAALFARTVEGDLAVLQINGGRGLAEVGFEGPVQVGTADANAAWTHRGHLDTVGLTVNAPQFGSNAGALNVAEATLAGTTTSSGNVTASNCRICLNVRGQVEAHSCVALELSADGGFLGLPPGIDQTSTFSLSYVCDGGQSGAGNGVVE